MKTLALTVLIPILIGCAPVPQTAGERPSSSQSSANASETVVVEEKVVSLRVCSESTFEFTYGGGDLITEIASYLHEQSISLQIKDLLITTTSSEPVVKIKDGVLSKPIPPLTKGTKLLIKGRICPSN